MPSLARIHALRTTKTPLLVAGKPFNVFCPHEDPKDPKRTSATSKGQLNPLTHPLKQMTSKPISYASFPIGGGPLGCKGTWALLRDWAQAFESLGLDLSWALSSAWARGQRV